MSRTFNKTLQDPISVSVPNYGIVLLRKAETKAYNNLLPIQVKTEIGELELDEFALPLIDSRPNRIEYWPLIHCAIGDVDHPFLAVLGLVKLVFVSPKAELLAELSLNRDLDNDWGFFRTDLIPCSVGCALATESMLVRLSPEGNVLWQLPLTLHDHLIHYSNRFLHLGSDELSSYRDGDWFVNLEDGRIILQDSMPAEKWIFPSTDY